MTTQQPDQPVDTIHSGNEAPRRSRQARGSLLAVAAAVALVVAVAAGAALAGDGADSTEQLAVAASGSASPNADDDERGGRFDGFRGRGHAFGHGFGHRFGRSPMVSALALHGTFVVPDGNDGFRTVVTQRGEVTAASDTSLTVKSEDGFVATYRLTDDTDVLGGTGGVGDIANGDLVGVAADRAGGVNTATHVVDLDQVGDFRRRHPGLPRPSSTATTEGTAAGA